VNTGLAFLIISARLAAKAPGGAPAADGSEEGCARSRRRPRPGSARAALDNACTATYLVTCAHIFLQPSVAPQLQKLQVATPLGLLRKNGDFLLLASTPQDPGRNFVSLAR